MNIERLSHLIAILQDVEARKLPFDMDQWLGEWEHGCGTAACAFGYGALDPKFQAEGLRLRFTLAQRALGEPGTIEITTTEQYTAATRDQIGQIEPVFGERVGFSAVCAFFDIPLSTADYVFNAANYSGTDPSKITPDRVIRRLEKVLGLDVADRPGAD
jgi:hypothetical protein